jgi:hypothetical protein
MVGGRPPTGSDAMLTRIGINHFHRILIAVPSRACAAERTAGNLDVSKPSLVVMKIGVPGPVHA